MKSALYAAFIAVHPDTGRISEESGKSAEIRAWLKYL